MVRMRNKEWLYMMMEVRVYWVLRLSLAILLCHLLVNHSRDQLDHLCVLNWGLLAFGNRAGDILLEQIRRERVLLVKG
jgi:hypothetical protein